ncbi:hypothetical protein SBOR_6224 [Sclerotinia borealis F-4128]|uniref:2EXR domain-containing protein n=1 Tax=Sclerotinia borealis (strain F-4128) TaxID=1432307 RepID=W9CF61_SCLBF|nr:hypothetical protein SBOR_6224 [Sclerotinia borealis F-4128]
MSSPTFHRFADLPEEIRLRIWQVVAECILESRRAIVSDATWQFPRNLGVLEVNREARREVLFRTGLTSFRRPLNPGRFFMRIPLRPAHDWSSMERDVFVIDEDEDIHIAQGFSRNWNIINAIQTVAIGERNFFSQAYTPSSRKMVWEILMEQYKGLKTLVFLRDDPVQEPTSYRQLIHRPQVYSHVDFRITIDPNPVPQLYLDQFGLTVQFF